MKKILMYLLCVAIAALLLALGLWAQVAFIKWAVKA